MIRTLLPALAVFALFAGCSSGQEEPSDGPDGGADAGGGRDGGAGRGHADSGSAGAPGMVGSVMGGCPAVVAPITCPWKTGEPAPPSGVVDPQCADWPTKEDARTECTRKGEGSDSTWTRCGGGVTNDDANAVAVGADGAIFLGGGLGQRVRESYQKEAKMCVGWDPAEFERATWGCLTSTSLGGEDAIVVKLSAAGELAATIAFGGPSDGAEVKAVAVDPTDEGLVVGGEYTGKATFAKGAMVSPVGIGDQALVAKYDEMGCLEWTYSPGSEGTDDAAVTAVAIDPKTQRIVAVGEFEDSLVVAIGASAKTLRGRGALDAFVVVLDKDGSMLSATSIGANHGKTTAEGVTVLADGGFAVTGEVEGRSATTLVFADAGAEGMLKLIGSTKTPPVNERAADLYVARFDADGVLQWAKNAGFPGQNARGRGVASDKDNNLYLAGRFDENLRFGDTMIAAAGGDHDALLAKLDHQGKLLWAKTAGGRGSDRAVAVAIHESGSDRFLYLGGRFEDTARFGEGAAEASVTVHSDTTDERDDDIFVAKYDLDGGLLWVKSAGGPVDDELEALGVDPRDGAAAVVGTFYESMQFEVGDTTETTLWAASTDRDAFISRYAP